MICACSRLFGIILVPQFRLAYFWLRLAYFCTLFGIFCSAGLGNPGCWCVYLSKKRELLYFGRVMRRVLVEAGGPVESLQIDCSVKEQSGSPGIFENIGSNLGQDIDIFNASNVLCRVQMVPKRGGKWVCKNFAKIKKIFSSTSLAERENAYNNF